MNFNFRLSFLFVSTIMISMAWAEDTHVNPQDPQVDTCIERFCVGKKELTFQSLRKGLGQGALTAIDKEVKTLCYFDAQQKLWFLLEFDTHSHARQAVMETIFVSTEPICTEKVAPLTTIHELKTNGGVRVGMTEAELIKLKGQPIRVDDQVAHEKTARFSVADTPSAPRFGEKVIVYLNEDRGEFNFFYIGDGKVKSILVSDAE